MDKRDYDDPEYKDWRKKVYARDRHNCRKPGCKGLSVRMNAHHIKRWSDFPELRFILANGITLCKDCHNAVTGNEEAFEELFSSIVNKNKSSLAMRMLMFKYADEAG